jgi:hypothetical protein
MKPRPITLSLPDDVIERVDQYAQALRARDPHGPFVCRSAAVRKLLSQALDAQEDRPK